MPLDAAQLAIAAAQVPGLLGNARVDGVTSGAEVESVGGRLLNASTDDLLGLSVDTRVREAAQAAARKHGVAAVASTRLKESLEERLGALLSSSVVVANAADPALHLVARTAGFVFTDRRGARHPQLPGDRRFDSADELEQRLPSAPRGEPLVLVSAVHQLDGDLCPLPRLAEVASRHGASLAVWDAHGAGILGRGGMGAMEHFELLGQADLHVLSLAGALGGAGVAVAGSNSVIDALRPALQDAPPPAALAATARALELLAQEPQRRTRLFELAQRLVDWLRQRGFDTGPTVTPWIPVWLGDAALTERWLRALAEAGVFCRGSLSPGRARLLFSVPATATDAQLDQLTDAIERVGRKLGVPALAPATLPTPVALARPGSFAHTTPAHPRWSEGDELRPPPMSVVESPQREQPLRARVLEAVETVTWRAANMRSVGLRRLLATDALRALVDKARGKS